MHFISSFVISGLIATTYTYFAIQIVVLRVLYPQMWSDPSEARGQTQTELRGLPAQLRRVQFIAVLIPLFGAALLIGAGPDHFTVIFRMLVTALIVLGLTGFFVATRMCNSLTQVLELLTGINRVGSSRNYPGRSSGRLGSDLGEEVLQAARAFTQSKS
jgi:hypothetical protein